MAFPNFIVLSSL